MSNQDNLKELFDVLEEIRKEVASDISQDVLKEIIIKESENLDNKLAAELQVKKILNNFLK